MLYFIVAAIITVLAALMFYPNKKEVSTPYVTILLDGNRYIGHISHNVTVNKQQVSPVERDVLDVY